MNKTEEEKEEFGNKDQLREENQELLKQKTMILQRDQNQGISSLGISSLITEGIAMDIDSTSQRAPFVRTKSDEEFIQTNNFDLRKPSDSLKYLIYLL